MKKYEELKFEIVFFTEDVVKTSSPMELGDNGEDANNLLDELF